jgi:hypothetical protein
MSATPTDPPPYRFAFITTAIVLLGYLVSLAPTVTFWDAGEFIASARILGIPHPPGTPLFVMLGHVWGNLLPIGEYAFRLNLMSAFFSALAAGAWFLVVWQSLQPLEMNDAEGRGRGLRIGGAMAAAVIGAFTFTNWQNSNETEVYGVASFMAATICWLSMVWRRQRGHDRAPRTLWLMLYIAGLSSGNHLLTLLVGPGVVLFMIATLRFEPASDPVRGRREWAETAVVGGTWALLIGLGLGSTALITVGGICYVAAAAFAFSAGIGRFAFVALVIAVVGITSYGFLYFRSQHHPMINEAQPDNFTSLLEVIQRKQYPPRTPLDDPTELSGPDNPGRTLSLVVNQLATYGQYFVWQWGNGLAMALKVVLMFVFVVLGFTGLSWHRARERPSWWLLFDVFLVTGLGLVVYMNFKPGFSLGYDKWPDPSDHEVRERDYFFVISFIIWGLWAGMGLAVLARSLAEKVRSTLVPRATLLAALVPFAANFTAASRAHGPAPRLAADFAYDLLNSVPPYGVLFTFGDNDTFPLWWAQEVGGIRQDVTIVCLALAQTNWYIKQLRDNPARPFDEAAAPAIWKGKAGQRPDWPLHTMTDEQIDQFTSSFTVLREARRVPVGQGFYTLPANSFVNPNQIVLARILQENVGKRPVSWSMTTGRSFGGLDPFMIQQGMAYLVSPVVPDTTNRDIEIGRLTGTLLDVRTTDSLAWHTYRYDRLIESSETDIASLESTARGMAFNLGLPFTQLALAFQSRGDRERTVANLERAAKLVADPQIKQALEQIRLEPFTGPVDSPALDSPPR